MAFPAIAAAAASKAVPQVTKILDTPIIGWRKTKVSKRGTKETSFQINGWHLAAGAGVVVTFVGLGLATGVLRWNKQTIQDAKGNTKAVFYLPGANPDAVDGGDGWIKKAAAGSAPNYIFGGGPLGVLLSALWGNP